MDRQKTVLITGSTDGIGRRAALRFAQKGYGVILHGRSAQRLAETRDEIQNDSPKARLWTYQADFFDLAQVLKLAGQVQKDHATLDALLNNASVFSPEHQRNAQGLERTFVVSHLAHFVLTQALWPLLQKALAARVVNVSSIAQARSIDFDNLQGERSYSGNEAYARAKLCNVLFTVELAARLAARLGADSALTVNALHPGVIDTKLLRTGWGIQGDDLDAGAQTELDAVDNPRWNARSGLYFHDLQVAEPAAIARDAQVRQRLWIESEKLSGVTFSL